MLTRRALLGATTGLALAPAIIGRARAAQEPGATDTEILFGNTYPYSGPASGYATNAPAESAYFRMVNERGGINGRQLRFLSYDDAASSTGTTISVRTTSPASAT